MDDTQKGSFFERKMPLDFLLLPYFWTRHALVKERLSSLHSKSSLPKSLPTQTKRRLKKKERKEKKKKEKKKKKKRFPVRDSNPGCTGESRKS